MKLTEEQKPNEWDCSLCYQESDEALFNGVDRVMTEGINKQPEDLLKLGYVNELAIRIYNTHGETLMYLIVLLIILVVAVVVNIDRYNDAKDSKEDKGGCKCISGTMSFRNTHYPFRYCSKCGKAKDDE